MPHQLSHADLYGTWRLLNVKGRDVATGEESDFFGKSPRGSLSYSPDGRMYAILTMEGRKKPADMAAVTQAERAQLFNSVIAYAGSFTVNGSTITHHVDISWNENWTDTDQIRNFRIDGDKLYISSNAQPSGADGKLVIAELTWERIK